jgi:Transposase IS116/IS110/IS902 family
VLIIGSAERFACCKQIGSYLGLILCEDSSADRRRLGHISKQGNTLLRFLLVEAAQAAVRGDAEWQRKFVHLAMRRDPRIAKLAMARKLAVWGRDSKGETYRVIDNEQLRPGFGCQCRELFRRCVVLRYEGVETFRHLGVEFESLRFVDQNITPIAGVDCLFRRIGIA